MPQARTVPEILPFRALSFAPGAGAAAALLAPPYDIIGKEQHRALLARSPHNVVRLELPEGGPPEAAATLTAWRDAGVLVRDAEPALYVYEQGFTHEGRRRTRRAFFGRVRLEPPDSPAIRPHERTHTGPREGRVDILRRLRVQTSPILALYHAAKPLELPDTAPILAAEVDGEEHRLWRVHDRDEMAAVLATVAGPIYIADGHHRYAAGLAWRDERRAETATSDGEPEAYILMALVDAADLLVLPTHRVLSKEVCPADAVSRLERYFRLESLGRGVTGAEIRERLGSAGRTAHAIACHGLAPNTTHLLLPRDEPTILAAMPKERSDAFRRLDVAVLDEVVLKAALDLKDGAAGRGELSYERDPDEARAAVDGGRAGLAFLLNGTPVEHVVAVADAGDLMPQKSTWFEPKLPTGLVLYPHE